MENFEGSAGLEPNSFSHCTLIISMPFYQLGISWRTITIMRCSKRVKPLMHECIPNPRAVLKALPDQKANGGELQQESIWENPSKNATLRMETWKTTKSMLTPIDWETKWKPRWKFTGTWQNSLLSLFLYSTMGFCIQQIVVRELWHQKTLCLALGLVLCTYMVAMVYNLKVRCCSVT